MFRTIESSVMAGQEIEDKHPGLVWEDNSDTSIALTMHYNVEDGPSIEINCIVFVRLAAPPSSSTEGHHTTLSIHLATSSGLALLGRNTPNKPGKNCSIHQRIPLLATIKSTLGVAIKPLAMALYTP
jgi:hypothetical protein